MVKWIYEIKRTKESHPRTVYKVSISWFECGENRESIPHASNSVLSAAKLQLLADQMQLLQSDCSY